MDGGVSIKNTKTLRVFIDLTLLAEARLLDSTLIVWVHHDSIDVSFGLRSSGELNKKAPTESGLCVFDCRGGGIS